VTGDRGVDGSGIDGSGGVQGCSGGVQGLSGMDTGGISGGMPAVSGVGLEAAAADLWWAVGYANRVGDVAQAWTVPLPAGFVDRLVNDPESLERETADRVAAAGGTLIECGPMMVDGRLGYYRIVRLPDGYLPAAVYVAGLLVPVDPAASARAAPGWDASSPVGKSGFIQHGIEITITTSALGELLTGRTE
jgi:hypothetical protein